MWIECGLGLENDSGGVVEVLQHASEQMPEASPDVAQGTDTGCIAFAKCL